MKKMYFVSMVLLLVNSTLAFSGQLPPEYPPVTTFEDHTDEEKYTDPNIVLKGQLLTITSTGTLIVNNLDLDNNSDLVIESGGVLIIEGNLITDNQMTIKAGGTLIVLGNFIHNGSDKNQGSFITSDPSNVYILGTIDQEDKPDKNDITDNPNYQVLDCDSSDGLTDYPSGCNYGKLDDLIENPVYQSICGQGVSGGEISNNSGSCYEAVELVNVSEADDRFRTYAWYYTTNSDYVVSNQPDSISKWNKISGEASLDCIYDGVVNSTTYFVRQGMKDHGCVVYTDVVIVAPSDPESVGGVVAADEESACEGDNVSLSLSGYIGVIVRWESSSDNWTSTSEINNVENIFLVEDISETTKFRAVVQSGSCKSATSSEINIVVSPKPIPIGIYHD